MGSNEILMTAIIASILWVIILYVVIKAATNSSKQTELLEKQNRFAEMQLRMLAEFLKKQGVSNEALFEIINLKNTYFSKDDQ